MRATILGLLLLITTVCLNADDANQELIKNKINALMPEMVVERITPSVIPGFYEVSGGGSVLYVSEDGKYLVQGDLYNIEQSKSVVNMTNETRKIGVKKLVDTLNKNDLIIYKAPYEKTYITVFTDIDCGYCRMLQKEVSDLNQAGISVRYAAFPRTPPGSKSYDKAVSVWCAADRKEAYARAMAGIDPAPLTCANNPVASQKTLGETLGISGTPTIIFKNGRLTPGYLPSKQMIEAVYQLGM